MRALRLVSPGLVVLLATVWLGGDSGVATAQTTPAASGQITKLTGRVEVLRKGQTQWGLTAVGARLGEGDEIRAHAGSSAEVELPDGSTLVLAEHSRLVVNQLAFDTQSKARTALFHLVAGKVRAAVAQAAITLVRARQSNFVITTPTAVAAVRGTIYEVTEDAANRVMRVGVIAKPVREAEPGRVLCAPYVETLDSALVQENLASEATPWGGCGAPRPFSAFGAEFAGLVGTVRNPIIPPFASFNDPVSVPRNIPGLTAGQGPVINTGFSGGDGPLSSTGADTRPASDPAARR